MRILWLALGVGVGCGGEDPSTGTDTGADTGTAGSTETAPPCTALSEGPWSASGSCFGMMMSATLTVTGAEGCRFTLDDWNMAMSVPEGGRVDGGDVTLTGAGWDGCTGTTEDGTSIEGSCTDGCTFQMTFEG